jgi:hypothetical protein
LIEGRFHEEQRRVAKTLATRDLSTLQLWAVMKQSLAWATYFAANHDHPIERARWAVAAERSAEALDRIAAKAEAMRAKAEARSSPLLAYQPEGVN